VEQEGLAALKGAPVLTLHHRSPESGLTEKGREHDSQTLSRFANTNATKVLQGFHEADRTSRHRNAGTLT
jgi:hypothetical protein